MQDRQLFSSDNYKESLNNPHCRALIDIFSICKLLFEQSKLPPKQGCRYVPTAVHI